MRFLAEKVGRTYKGHRILVKVFEPIAERKRTDDDEGSYKPIMRATAYDVHTREEIHGITAFLAITDDGERQLAVQADESKLPGKGIGSTLLRELLGKLCNVGLEDAWPVFIQFPDGCELLRAKLREMFESQENMHPNTEMVQYQTVVRSTLEYGLREEELSSEDKIDIVQFINGNNRLPILVTTEAGYIYAKKQYEERIRREIIELDFEDSNILGTRLIGEIESRKERPLAFCRNLDALGVEQQARLRTLLEAGSVRLIAAFFDHDNLEHLEGCKPPIADLIHWGRPFAGSVE